jgi:hypothetical protein
MCQLNYAIPFTRSRAARKAPHSFFGWPAFEAKLPAPPGGEEPQTFNLGLVPPQQKMTPSDFRV